jgi:TatD DNase family protein
VTQTGCTFSFSTVSPMFIDTHTHLYSDAFAEDRDAMIQRAIDAGVEQLLLPNIDVASIEGMYALERKYPKNCFPMMGLHPTSVKEDWEEQLSIIKKHLFQREFIAVGEIGIDLYWDKQFQQQQTEAFIQQINWAKGLNIPIVIHARESFPEIFEVLDQHNDDRLKGIFHCFTGTAEDAAKISNYGGFLLGIGGVLTFKKSGLDQVVENLPLESLVLETDSPYLAPTPYRGKRNESAYIPVIAERLSEIFAVSTAEIAEITTANARQLFKLNS